MRTYISWVPTVEQGEKMVDIPEDTPIECPKLNRGDIVSLDTPRSRRRRILIPVRVASVLITISWRVRKHVKAHVDQDAEQYLLVEPAILDSKPT
ncbi:hypothetical protein SDC9_10368 [bioreactor metagenome]|jgi:hypothetical protein|uniref:Uncharacterized protein n=2 Tax=root TaxID=1 RepID=A0AB33HZU5_9CHLR|nr:hypothetical protein DEHALATV1_0842 [Dehalococcoides mccartyi]